MEGYIGEIRWFSANFAPRFWMYCQGQILSIASNTALFSILGTTYGGNGTTTFALPDFRGRVAVGTGTGAGLQVFDLGQTGGSETNTLTTANMPSHTHTAIGTVHADSGSPTANSPVDNFPATSIGRDSTTGSSVQVNMYSPTSDSQGNSAGVQVTIGNNGGNLPMNNIQPSLGMGFIICVQGIFPSRG